MRKDHFTEEALRNAQALAELKYSENPEDQLAFAEAYDFARCQRPDGSFYGTAGQCRKGKQAGAKQEDESKTKSRPKPEIDESKLYRLMQKSSELTDRLGREKELLKRMSKTKKGMEMRAKREERIQKLQRSLTRIQGLRAEANKRLDEQAQKSGNPRALMPPNWGTQPGGSRKGD